MSQIIGNTSTSATSTANSIAAKIISFSLVNKTGGSLTVAVALLYGSTNTYIYSGTIAANATYTNNVERKLLAGYSIYLLVNGSCDYKFDVE